jgi:ArsR family transcriptional regulator, virulence genes transcriptional regulator
MLKIRDEIFEVQANYCAMFGNPNRLKIMFLLHDGEKTVGEISSEIGKKIQSVSQHLRAMRDRNVVATRRDGRNIYYHITNPKFIVACNIIREALMEEEEKRNRLFNP